MGVVYRARDPELDRVVALKVVRASDGDSSGSDGDATARARMLREAQALAAVTHPNVIPVYDVRRTSVGLCIAMEYVQGPTLRGWKDESRSWTEVVALFRQAGAGLLAAHEAGLCHRDFKPSNVLVGRTAAGAPWVRVVDFGLARPAGAFVSEGGAFATSDGSGQLTEAGSVVGTPSYMSPEQHRGDDVGPASDQYSFCVSLYWALHGKLPFSTRGRSLRQVLRYKQQCDLPRSSPSRDVPNWLHRLVLRGLSPDPDSRFPGMRELLAGLESGHKRGRRLSWVAATLVGVAGTAGLAVAGTPLSPCAVALAERPPWSDGPRAKVEDALAAGTATGTRDSWRETWQGLDAGLTTYAAQWTEARSEVCETTATRDDGATREALECLAQGQRSVEAIVELFSQPDAALLSRADALLDALPRPGACTGGPTQRSSLIAMPQDPWRAAEVAAVAGDLSRVSMIMSAGRYDEAADELRPVEASARVLGHAPLLAQVLLRKGQISRLRGEYKDSELALVESHTFARAGGDTLTAIDAASALCYTVGYRLGRHEDGERWYREADASLIRAGMTESVEAALHWDNWGSVLTGMARFDDALDAHQRALAIRERVEPEGAPGLAVSLGNIAAVLLDLGRAEEARVHYERALEIRRAALGPEHPKVVSTMGHLGATYDDLGETTLARRMLEDAMAVQERVLGPEHISIATSATNLSAVLHREREYDRALVLQERALAIWETAYGPDHARVAIGHNNVASTLRELGRRSEAVTHYERALAVAEISMGSAHPNVGTFLDNLGDMMRLDARYVEALAYYERALEVRTTAFGENHRAVADALADIALCHKGLDAFDESLAFQERANAIYRDALGEEHPSYFSAQNNLGNALAAVGRLSEARELHEATLAKRTDRFGDEHFATAGSHVNLADVLLAMDEPRQALPHFERAHEIWSEELPADDERVVAAKEGRDTCRRQIR